MEVKEAYCSYELAKLLVKKGFNSDLVKGALITHQLACAWVRSKGYSVEVHATAVGWVWEVCTVDGILIANSGARDDYDECTDSALMYALTEVI